MQSLLRALLATIAVGTALLSGMFAVTGVDELESRRYYRALLDERISATQAEIAEIAARKIPLNVQGFDVDALQSQLVELKSARSALRQLVETGASSNHQTLRRIKLRFTDSRASAEVLAEGWLSETASGLGYAPDTLRDDSVLAAVMFFAALFGACIASLRSSEISLLKLFVGGVIGLLVFFLLKGGNVVFVLGRETAWISYNPYSFAFAALLAGLFSESAYRALGVATDSLVQKWIKSLRKDSTNSADPK